MKLISAETKADFDKGESLFREYIQSLDFELSFQDVDRELREIAINYNRPEGALLLVFEGDRAIACVGIRQLEAGIAELKRMYVCPEFRGQQLGKKLLESALEEARKLGYKTIRLDTVADMCAAIKLYQKFGFKEIAAYRFNPIPGALYLERKL